MHGFAIYGPKNSRAAQVAVVIASINHHGGMNIVH